jgi:hypothetical protein
MPKQSLLRFIKRWKRYEPRKSWSHIPKSTRGVYVLYSNGSPHEYRVVYIGVAGLGPTGGGGIRSRIKRHDRKVKKWTHDSFLRSMTMLPVMKSVKLKRCFWEFSVTTSAFS